MALSPLGWREEELEEPPRSVIPKRKRRGQEKQINWVNSLL